MSLRTSTTTMGGLSCRVVDGSGSPPRLVAVFCHGFGAAGDNLVDIAAQAVHRRPVLAEGVRFVFPEAPLGLEGLGVRGGRAWWLFDFARLAGLGPAAALAASRRETPEGLARARRLLSACLAEVLRVSRLPPSRLVLGGFSQGAMLATDAALRLEEPPAALVVLSGTLLSEEDWRRRARARAGLRVLQSHGRQDPLLPFAAAEALQELLRDAGLAVDFRPFDGGHTVPLSVLEAVADLLHERLASPA